MRLVQSQAAVARPRPGRPQKGCGIRKLAFALSLACLFAPASARAQNAYITNSRDNTVSVIDTATNTVVGSPITVGGQPFGVAVTSNKVYVTNINDGTISVIDTATNKVVGSPIHVGSKPMGVAVTPDGSKVYVANEGSNDVEVIDTATNTVEDSPISVGIQPQGVAVTPDGSKVYIGNFGSNNVSVIDTTINKVEITFFIPDNNSPAGIVVTPDGKKVYVANFVSNFPAFHPSNIVSVFNTATLKVVASITVALGPFGVAITPDGSKVLTANRVNDNVSVVATATNTVIATIPSGTNPTAFGKFIQPLPNFAGTPGRPNCRGVTVSALAQKYGELSAAAAAFGLAVMDLQNAIGTFCGGSSQTF